MKNILFALLLTPCLVNAQIADSAQRKIPLKGGVNFRDLGGYTTKSGKHVKWGKIYRSGEMNALTTTDLDTLAARNIHYVLDFRGPSEVKAAPDKLPVNALRISLPYGSENVGNDRAKMFQQMSKASNGDSIMLPFYADLTPFTQRYKPVFETLLNNSKDSAVLYHCTAGKDRTGISSALILYALGVDEATIMQDYLATNYYYKPNMDKMKQMMIDNYHLKPEVVEDVVGVKEKYLAATFAAIKEKYGSIDNYLQQEMGLDKKALKQLRKAYLD